jgi:ABC-type lipoprotein export system ATPase subunit
MTDLCDDGGGNADREAAFGSRFSDESESTATAERESLRKWDEVRKDETSVFCYAPDASLPMVRLEGVSKEFDGASKLRALDNITLHIGRGDIVSIVGPSGSGKSTLLNLIGTLDRPTSGYIAIDGQDISSLNDRAVTRLRREKIGFVFQFFNLLPSLTCLQNVGLPLHLGGWSGSRVRERAHKLLDLVGLGDRLDHLPDELSGGERQRVAIARALGYEPPLLLADEPTGNLDSTTGKEILALLQDLHERLGSTIVLVTHDESVAGIATCRITLRDARIAEERHS